MKRRALLAPAAAAEALVGGQRDEEECDEVCAACLKAGRVSHRSEWRTDEIVQEYVRAHVKPAARRRKVETALKAELRATPRLPRFLQVDDWPLCCEHITEFRGSPSSMSALLRLARSATYWEQRAVVPCTIDFEVDGEPESLDEVSTFKCSHCAAGYWLIQFT